MCAMSRDPEGSSSASGRSTPLDSEESDPKRNAGARQTPNRDSSRKSRKTKQLRRLLPADRIPRSVSASRPMLPPAALPAIQTNGTTNGTHMNILDFSTPDDDLFNPVHPPSSFPPVPYPQNSHPEYTYSHRRHHSGRMRPEEKMIMSTRLDRIESAIKGYMIERGQQALRRSELPQLNTNLSETFRGRSYQ